MADLVIRRATPADLPAMAALFLAARRAMLSFVPMVHPDESVLPWMQDHLMAETALWVAEKEGDVVALLSLSKGWVEHLYVHPACQNDGVGTALLAFAKADAMAAEGLQLWTFQGNHGARRFYERHGFAAVEFTNGSGNEEHTPDIRFAWRAGR